MRRLEKIHAKTMPRAFIGILLVGLFQFFASNSQADEGDPQPVPLLQHRVTDLTATLSKAEEADIETRLGEFEKRKGSQIAVLIVPTTQPESIFDYSLRVAESWKLGRKGVDDGVLFVVAKNDRKMQILTGPGLSGSLTDAMSKRIISEVVSPKFRSGDYAGGIATGVDRIISVIDGEALPAPPSKRVAVKHIDYEGFITIAIFAGLFVGTLLRALLGRFLGASLTGAVTGAAAWWLTGGLLFPVAAGVIIFFVVLLAGLPKNLLNGWGGTSGGWSSSGSSSGGSWSSGSSDSFSGGGGSFDGGGASGDW